MRRLLVESRLLVEFVLDGGEGSPAGAGQRGELAAEVSGGEVDRMSGQMMTAHPPL